MATKARRAGSLSRILNANTAASSNVIVIDSGGDITVSGDLTVTGGVAGYISNAVLQQIFAQNSAIAGVGTDGLDDRLQVANAAVLYVTKAGALTTNNAVVNLIDDRLQVANAAVTYVTKAVALSANNDLINLTDDRLQVANAAVSYLTKATALTTNNAVVNLIDDRLQVANAAVTYLTKATALTSNNALVNLVNDRLQVANAAVTYVTKSVHLTSNNALVNLINDRYQVANLSSDLVSYWPSANIIAYVAAAGAGGTMNTNTSIFIATGGETKAAIPYSNTNHLSVLLNGVRLTPGQDYSADDNVNIGNMLPLAADDILMVTEYKQHTANTLDRSAGAGGGGSNIQGSASGYLMGGYRAGSFYTNTVEKISLTSDGNATDTLDLAVTVGFLGGGNQSLTDGYATGGVEGTAPPVSTAYRNHIQKFSFSTEADATDVADLTRAAVCASSQNSTTNGYTSGGKFGPSSPSDPTPLTSCTNIIDKFPFSSDSNATDVGDLAASLGHLAGQSSSSNGYTTGGYSDPSNVVDYTSNRIQKFPFSSDTNATDVADLTQARIGVTGSSSDASGYSAGGMVVSPPPTGANYNIIDKFPFSSDTNATDVGDLTVAREQEGGGTGISSTSSGYMAGGRVYSPVTTICNTIDKYSFSSDGNATDVGDMTGTGYGHSAANV